MTSCLRVCGAPQPAQSSTRHVLYINICIRDTSYHLSCISVVFVRDLREVLSLCLVPPACTSATGITLKNAFDKCIADAAFCCRTEAVCMDVWTRQANTSHTRWQRTLVFHWSSNKHAVLEHWGRDLCDMSACSGARCFFLQYLDNCERIDIILPACCAFSLCYPFQGEFWEEESWQSEALFLFLHSSLPLSLSLQVGPDGGFGGRMDRRLLQ